MSEVANRRNCIESVRLLCTSSRPTEEMVSASIKSLAQVLSDLVGEEVRLQIKMPAAPHNQQQGE